MFDFGNDTWAQSKQLFADQFEPDDDQYLYRRSQKGPPVRVSIEERQRFIDDYARRLRYSTWGMIAGLLLFTGAVIWWTFQTEANFPDITMYVGIGAIAAVNIAYALWAQGAPARELVRRTPAGRERTRAEMQRLMMKKTSYGHLAAVAFAGAVFPFTLRSGSDVFRGWGRLWLVFGIGIVLLAAIAAFRKWRLDRERDQKP